MLVHASATQLLSRILVLFEALGACPDDIDTIELVPSHSSRRVLASVSRTAKQDIDY